MTIMERSANETTTRPIRICRVIARMNVGGPAVHVIQLTAGLDSQRFDQQVVTGIEASHEASLVPLARQHGIEPVILSELGREVDLSDDLVALLRLWRLFRAWHPDIVETHTAKAGTLGRLAAWLAGVPVRIHVFHGHVFHGYFGRTKTRVFLEIERALARISTRIIALGETQRFELLALGVGRPDQVVSIPLGFDLDAFQAAIGQGQLRRELGVGEAPLVGIVGRLAPIKRHDVFVEMARLVLQQLPEAHFVVVGDGERRAAIEAQARRALGDHVHFLGWRGRNDLPGIYADLDVVALTSDNEGMPVSLIEAMATGTPVVATEVGGVPDVVRQGETGLLAPKGDGVALATACLQLLRSPERRAQFGKAARAAVFPDYTLTTLLARMDRFYTSLVPAVRQPAAARRVM